MPDIRNKFRTRYRDVLQKSDGTLLKIGDSLEVDNRFKEYPEDPDRITITYAHPPHVADRESTFYRGRFLFSEDSYGNRSYKADELGMRHLTLAYREHSPWRSSAINNTSNHQRVRHPLKYGRMQYAMVLG